MADFTGTPAVSKTLFDQLNNVPEAFSLANLRGRTVSYVHSLGAGTGEVDLYRLPAGKIRLVTALCNWQASQFDTDAVLSIGFREYEDGDGNTVDEDPAAFVEEADVATGATSKTPFALPAAGYLDIDSADGVIVFATVAVGNIENNDTILTRLYWL